MLKLKIEFYTHFFKVTKIHPSIYPVMAKVMKDLKQVKFVKIRGKFRMEGHKMYAARNVHTGEYRFHINYYPVFRDYLSALMVQESEIEKVDHRDSLYEAANINIELAHKFIMRDYQEEAINYILEDGYSKLITLPTGFGKSITSSKAASLYGKRMLIMVLGRYKEKWRDDIIEHFDGKVIPYMVKGLSDLLNLVELGMQGKELPEVIIVTTTVIQMYIKEWEDHAGKQIEGMVPPEDIYKYLGVGYRCIDEAHQHFHAVFKNDLYTHCPKTIYLTATLESSDRFMRTMYETMWPMSQRTTKLNPGKYDNTIALFYQHEHADKVRFMGPQGYSHAIYENSIWKHVPSKCQYLDMIGDVVEQRFLPHYEPGKRMLIFCSLVNTCEDVAHYLRERFKEKNWQISKFVAGDPKEVIDTNDITVSTLGKAGTALDVNGLITVLMTTALAEPKANIQAKGRLRDLSKKPGFEHIVPEFLYFVANDIERHRVYHNEKKMLFAERTLSHTEANLRRTIGVRMKDYIRSNEKRLEAWKIKDIK